MGTWDDAKGVACPKCKAEAYQIREGVCIHCWRKKQAAAARDIEEKAGAEASRVETRDRLRARAQDVMRENGGAGGELTSCPRCHDGNAALFGIPGERRVKIICVACGSFWV